MNFSFFFEDLFTPYFLLPNELLRGRSYSICRFFSFSTFLLMIRREILKEIIARLLDNVFASNKYGSFSKVDGTYFHDAYLHVQKLLLHFYESTFVVALLYVTSRIFSPNQLQLFHTILWLNSVRLPFQNRLFPAKLFFLPFLVLNFLYKCFRVLTELNWNPGCALFLSLDLKLRTRTKKGSGIERGLWF